MIKGDEDEKREQKRNTIMQAALKVFSRKGYSPAALEEVAREASIAKGTLYLYFRDKADLFSSTILFVINRLVEIMRENISKSMGPLEVMRSIAYTELEYFAKNTEFFGLIRTAMGTNLLGDHENLFSIISDKRLELVQYLTQIVQSAQSEALIRKDIEAEEIVYGYLGMMESALDQIGFKPEDQEIDIEQKVDTIMKILLEGIMEGVSGM
ncbi:MAG TPA: TetR/AcrR family transcriptional regulator [Spirochaetota bacterium]|nr:TetR/AcrR family transcriptional regulator [Spirochaetota bacterium]